MRVENSKKLNLFLFTPDVFEDSRGEYIELYNEKAYDFFKKIKFVQDDISVSYKGILRGIHGDDVTWKLISCLLGRIYFVVVNCDMSSKEFGQWESFVLSDKNRMQVLVPPKYGNGHYALSSKVIFHYKQSTYYNSTNQFSYKWNEDKFGIRWPIDNPVLSFRDFNAKTLKLEK